jgi:hypothetical protein
MASSWINVGVEGLQDFDKAATDLQYVEREFPGWVHRDMSESMDSIKKNAARRIMEEKTHGRKHTGLRASIAAGLKVSTFEDETGSGFSLRTTVRQPDEGPIPRGFDAGLSARGWRHPVFGNKKKWVQQRGNISWFSDSVNEEIPVIEQKIQDDVEKAIQRLS